MGMPLNKAYRMSLSLVSDGRVTQSLWPHHTEPLTKRNKQRYQNRGENRHSFEFFSSRRNDSLIIYICGGMAASSLYAEEWLPHYLYIMSSNDWFMRQPLWRWDNQWTREHVHELSLEEGRKTKSGQTCYMKPSRLGTRDELGVGFLSGY